MNLEAKNTKQPKVAVCVITCFRPDGLQRLLEGLVAQKFVKNAPPDLHLAIVDNDAAGSARLICEEFKAKYNLKLEYDIEEQRGIPFARNHCVDMVKDKVDFIAIIDDDEVPAHDWLDELIAAQREFNADILTGPVKSYFMEQTEEWLFSFFGSGNLPNGKNLKNKFGYVYTSNLYARAELFQHIRFEEQFRSNGSDDTHLFMQVYDQGYKAVWADKALVTEWVPGSRTNFKWLWQRAYSQGNGFALCELVRNPNLATRIQRLSKGIFRLVQGIMTAVLSLGRKVVFVKGIQKVFLGLGMITGSLGSSYQEYTTIHEV